ncbi:MAG: 50S ribosomal protein L23 [Bacilli bacterium]|nr:50S ribosomal protein L23 [Bacilli bacterium]MBQ9834462.1 50S ribosomal protein L23 [Bacilli bacterium]
MKDYTDIIIAPVITEKSATNAQNNVYTFKVAKSAAKNEIKWAVEKAFNVHVVKVNTLNTKAKDKRVGRYTGQTKTYKKAIVTLKDGETIEI